MSQRSRSAPRPTPWVLAVAVVLACAGSGPSSPAQKPEPGDEGNRVASGFPEPEIFEQLEEQPASGDLLFRTRFRDVDEWQLQGPFPDVVDAGLARSGEAAWDPLLDEWVARRAGLLVATGGMECFAREMGRFAVQQEVLPGLALQGFISGRCAVATAPPEVLRFWWESEQRFGSVEQALETLRDDIAARLNDQVLAGPSAVGIWMHVDGRRFDVVVAQGRRSVRIDPVDTRPGADGAVVLAGEVLFPVAQVAALVTQGELGWAQCQAREGVALPRFHLTCRVDPGDERAWVSLQILPPGSILTRFGLSILVRPGGREVSRYRRHAYAPSRPVQDDAQVPPAFLEVLNEVRARAGAPPLQLALEQSRVAGEVASHYFDALADPARAPIAELVALGMMAGWEVPEIVQEGRFTFMWLVESRDVASLLSDALDHPASRMVLLDAKVERVAVGPLAGGEGERQYLALIAATYDLFSESEHRANAERVFDDLAMARVERSRMAPRSLERARPLAVAAASRVQAGEPPRIVLDQLMQQSAEAVGRSVTGWYGEVQDLGAVAFPTDFLERRELEVAIAVAFHQPAGEPWGRYVVLMVAAEPERRGT